MGQIKDFEPEKLIMGIIYSDTDVLEKTLKILIDRFGEIEDVCEEYSFSDEFSTYYDEELGGKGTRRICTFRELVPPDMQAVYDYIHQKQIDHVHDVKMYVEQYKG